MKDEQKEQMIKEVMEHFDFEHVHSLQYIQGRRWLLTKDEEVPPIDKIKAKAWKLLRMVMEHTDRESYWASAGGFIAYYGQKNGLFLFYSAVRAASKIRELDNYETDIEATQQSGL